MSIAGERYAKAIFDLAVLENAVLQYQNELTAVSQIYETDSGLKTFLLSPKNGLATKKKVLTNIFGGTVGAYTLRLLLLLLDKGRIKTLPDLCAAYVKMADAYLNIVNISVTTALPLFKEEIDHIGKTFKELWHGASFKVAVKTDPSLIGGVKILVDGRQYDATVKGAFLKMQSFVVLQ